MKNNKPKWDDTEEIPAAGPSWEDTTEYVEPEKTSMLESGARGLLQGVSLGFSDEIIGALESALTNKTYKQARDESRANNERAERDNPGTYMTGEIGGGVATAFVPGVGLAGNTLKGAVGLGAAAGLGNSKSDLTKGEVGGALLDTATGATLGAAGHGIGKGVGKIYDKVMPENISSKVSGKLAGFAEDKAEEALNPTLSQMERVLERDGSNVGRRLLDEGVLVDKTMGIPHPARPKAIFDKTDVLTKKYGKEIGQQLDDVQEAMLPDFRIPAKDIELRIKQDVVAPNIQTPAWKGAKAVNDEAEMISSWGKDYTLRELNQLKAQYGARIKDWGSENLSDKALYQDMYDSINDLIEESLEKRAGPEALAKFKASKKQYGELEAAEKIAKKSSARDAKNNDFGLTSYMVGAGALASGNPVSALAVAGGREGSRRYGDASLALVADKVSKMVAKAPEKLGKYGPVLQKAIRNGTLIPTIKILTEDYPDFKEKLQD